MLRFKLGPFPVQVYISFLFAAVILGYAMNLGLGWRLLVWIAIVFLSVLVHELGHAIVGRAYGGQPEIHLEGFGGATDPRFPRPPGPGKQIVLSLAGPAAGLLLGLAGLLLVYAVPPAPDSPTALAMELLIDISWVWAIFNLLPMLPLDGGKVMLSVIEWARRRPSLAVASWISAAIAVVLGVLAFFVQRTFDPIFFALWCGFFAFQNIARARAIAASEPHAVESVAAPPDAFHLSDVDAATEKARLALEQRDYDTALAVAARLENAGGPFRQAAALRLRAGIELARGDNESAALYAGQSYSIWQSPDAAVVAARANLRSGQVERARNWLRRAVEAGATPAAVRADPELGALAAS